MRGNRHQPNQARMRYEQQKKTRFHKVITELEYDYNDRTEKLLLPKTNKLPQVGMFSITPFHLNRQGLVRPPSEPEKAISERFNYTLEQRTKRTKRAVGLLWRGVLCFFVLAARSSRHVILSTSCN